MCTSPINLQTSATRARAFASNVRASIRYAAALVEVFAFVLLCILSSAVSAEDSKGARIEKNPNVPSSDTVRSATARGEGDTIHTDSPYSPDNDVSEISTVSDRAIGSSIDHAVLERSLIGGSLPFADGFHRAHAFNALITTGMLNGLLLVVTTVAAAALLTTYRLRNTLTRLRKRWRRLESAWQRRHAAAHARELIAQSAQTLAAGQAAQVVAQARCAMVAALRRDLAAPLAAIEGLLETWISGPLALVQRPQASTARVAVKTGMRILETALETALEAALENALETALDDTLDPQNKSCSKGQTMVLDESDTDLRDLIDGVIALFSIAAAQKGLSLKVRIDRSADLRILVDGTRLGQIIYHLLNEALRVSPAVSKAVSGTAQIEFAAWAESLNGDLQQVFFSATRFGGGISVEGAARTPASFRIGFGTAADPLDDSGFTLYRLLVDRMHGEMTVMSDPDFGTRWTFSAPFATSLVPQPLQPLQPLLRRETVQKRGQKRTQQPTKPRTSPSVPTSALNADPDMEDVEPFDRHYLEALSREGLDLHSFLRGLRHSVENDLTQLHRLRREGDAEGLRALLHRLSGAVGMVGGHSLMEALQDETAAGSIPETGALDALVQRTRLLLNQLDATFEQLGSGVQ